MRSSGARGSAVGVRSASSGAGVGATASRTTSSSASLVPRRLAQPATAASIADARRRAEAAERAAVEQVEKAEENAALLRKTVLTISHQAGDDGRLFGSVTAQDIVDAVRQARGVKLDKRRVRLSEPIKTTGTHMVTVEVVDGVTADVKTIVTTS